MWNETESKIGNTQIYRKIKLKNKAINSNTQSKKSIKIMNKSYGEFISNYDLLLKFTSNINDEEKKRKDAWLQSNSCRLISSRYRVKSSSISVLP